MGADKLNAVGDLPLQRFPGAGFHIFMAEQRLALRPALNPSNSVPDWFQFGSPPSGWYQDEYAAQ
jgi:hypothetical protein